MNLQERLMADLKDAMRTQDTPRKEAIRMVRAAIQNAKIAAQRELSDDEVQVLIAREIRMRNEAIELFRQGKREDLVAQEEAQVIILKRYLPQQLSREEIVPVVQRIIEQIGATSPNQLGLVMREAMAQLKGQAEGQLVNQIARELLAR